MYYADLGFKKDPFGSQFDSDFLFQSKSWSAVYHNLAFEIQANREVILLTGEPGVGKSWLLKSLESGLDSQAKFVFQKVGAIDYRDFVENLCTGLELHTENRDFSQKLQSLNDYLSKGQHAHIVLVIEDAHQLSDELLTRIITIPLPLVQQTVNFQIILSGHPNLGQKYRRIETDNPCAPSSASITLEPFEQGECGSYIRRRLRIAGKPDSGMFPSETVEAIWRCSDGVPARINRLCYSAIRFSIQDGRDSISPDLITRLSRIKKKPEVPSHSEPIDSSDRAQNDSSCPVKTQNNRLPVVFMPLIKRRSVRILLLGAAMTPLLNFQFPDIRNKQFPAPVAEPKIVESFRSESAANERPDFLLAEYFPRKWSIPLNQVSQDNQRAEKASDAINPDTVQARKRSDKNRIMETERQTTPTPNIDARALIRKQEREGYANPDELYRAACSLSERHLDADAYLLYFRAARLGHRDSAFVLGRINDPTIDRIPVNGLGKPDTIQAYKWYKKAAQAGHKEARFALNRLRSELDSLASAGDVMAHRWLLQWD